MEYLFILAIIAIVVYGVYKVRSNKFEGPIYGNPSVDEPGGPEEPSI